MISTQSKILKNKKINQHKVEMQDKRNPPKNVFLKNFERETERRREITFFYAKIIHRMRERIANL